MSSTPSASASDAGAPVVAAYRKYWQEKVRAYAQASVEGTALKKYAVAEAYVSAEVELKAMKAKGFVTKGQPVLKPQVTSVDTHRKVARATLADCTDVSGWKLVRKGDGTAVQLPSGRRTKYVSRVDAEQWYGTWVITKVTLEDRSC
ncbi:hypothetical protein [Streptomyces sp. NPDC004286]|uniref:hypothetical protein n=1 Tax=Streptomyces sp. NPDC004286 TaxID=3364696 RepID=UPI0036AA3B63